MKNLLHWMQHHQGWKTMLALVYATICVFDFIIVPAWIGLIRVDLLTTLDILSNIELSQYSKDILVEAFTDQHKPFTLQGGGLFHLAFGALLTGSAIAKHHPKDPS